MSAYLEKTALRMPGTSFSALNLGPLRLEALALPVEAAAADGPDFAAADFDSDDFSTEP